MKNKKQNILRICCVFLLFFAYVRVANYGNDYENNYIKNDYIDTNKQTIQNERQIQNSENDIIASYNGYDFYEFNTFDNNPIIYFNNNNPLLLVNETITSSYFESYSPLDNLGRCGAAFAKLSIDTMPTEPRGKIGMIKPSGWKTIKYDNVDGKYLYNRCHLIGFQLSGENANELNLITGTRYFNNELMLPFENEVANYIRETNNHVLHRVTPLYKNDELVARGVVIEAYSVEDKGKGIEFSVFLYNIQPNININYENGESELIEK